MNYQTLTIDKESYVNDTEKYIQQIVKTEIDLHVKTKENLSIKNIEIAQYYKPK